MLHVPSLENAVMTRLPHPRFVLFLVVLVAAGALMAPHLAPELAGILAFDLAAGVFVLSALPLWANDDPTGARGRAARDDGGRVLLMLVAVAVLGAILLALARLIGDPQPPGGRQFALVVGTLVLAWLFVNLVLAFHYAHQFYDQRGGQDAGGIVFPGDEPPLFADFVYFAFTIGMTCQTADLNIAARRIRRVVTLHGLFAFFFNIGVLAMVLNVFAGVL